MTKPEKTRSGKSKMAASKLQVRVNQLVQQIATKFQVQYLCFRGTAIQWNKSMIKQTEPGSGKSKMAAGEL